MYLRQSILLNIFRGTCSQTPLEGAVFRTALLPPLLIDNTGRCYLGMARALQCTRQMSGQLPSIISQLRSHTAKNQLHHLLLWSLLTQQL